MRKLLLLASLAVLAAAALVVPLPLLSIEAGPALEVPRSLDIDRDTDPVTGRLLLTTVSLRAATAVDALAALLDGDEELLRQSEVIPPGVDEEQYFEAQRDVFAESTQVAAAVALRAAGFDVEVAGGGVAVASVLSGSPADGRLEPGDELVAIDGNRVTIASDVVAATSARDAGDPITLTYRRGEQTRDIEIRLRRLRELNRPGLGIALRTINPTIELPFDVGIDRPDIGGPSAGLMIALSVFDLVDDVDLTRGRVIAGTGTIDVAGRVGPIGGVAEKVEGARKAGATVFLAPAGQAAEARRAAPRGMEVLAVSSFDDAVRKLGAPARR